MGDRRLPNSCSTLTPHFRGALVAVDDWRCAGHDPARPVEEWCNEDRVAFTRRGAWSLEAEGDVGHADAGTTTFWRAGESYQVRHPVPGGDQCTVLRLTARGTASLHASLAEAVSSRPVPAASDPISDPIADHTADHIVDHRADRLPWRRRTTVCTPTVYLLHRRILEESRRHAATGDAVGLEERVLATWHALLVEHPSTTPRAERAHARLAGSAREVIAARHREPLRVDDIARDVGCSPFHLSRLYRRTQGETLHRTLTRVRLREVLERLLDTPDDLARIALDAGFASHSHLTDAVRAEYGVSPTRLRALLRSAVRRGGA